MARLHPRLWVYRCYDTVTDPNGTVRDYLDQRFLKLEDVGFAGSSYIRVQLYQTSPQGAPPRASARHWRVPPTLPAWCACWAPTSRARPSPAQPLYLSLFWQAPRPWTRT